MSSELKELSKGSIIVFLGNLFSRLILFISVIIIGRLLGAEIYGQFVYIHSIIIFFGILPKLGLGNGIVSFLSRGNIDINEKRSLLTYSILVSGILSLIIIFISFFLKDNINSLIFNNSIHLKSFLLFLPIVFFESINLLLMSALRAFRKIKFITLIKNIINPIVKTIFIVVLIIIFNFRNFYTLLIPLYFITILKTIAYLVEINKMDLIGKIKSTYNNKKIIKFSIPLLFAGIVGILTQHVDKFMVGYFLGSKEVGIYKIAIQFGTISSMALVSLNTIFSPIISDLYHDNRINNLAKVYKYSTKWILIINIMILGFVIIFSANIMRVVGKEFVIGGTALIIITLGQMFNSLVGSAGDINVMTGHPKYDLFSAAIAMIVNIILNIFLINIYGINGAAFATLIALLIRSILNLFLLYKNLQIHPYNKSYINLFLVMFFLILIIKPFSNLITFHYLLELFIYGVIYSIIFIILIYNFVLDNYEISILKNKLKTQLLAKF